MKSDRAGATLCEEGQVKRLLPQVYTLWKRYGFSLKASLPADSDSVLCRASNFWLSFHAFSRINLTSISVFIRSDELDFMPGFYLGTFQAQYR